MLDEDKDVPADRKYLVFVSDGITYMFNEKPTAVAWSFKADTNKYFAGPDNWKSQYENNNPPVNWSDTLATIGTKSASQGGVYDYPYGETPEKLTEADKMNNYANSVEKALYLTEQNIRQ